MGGMMNGSKGFGAAKAKGHFILKKKKKGAAKKAAVGEKVEDLKTGDSPAEEGTEPPDMPPAGKIKKRMASETY